MLEPPNQRDPGPERIAEKAPFFRIGLAVWGCRDWWGNLYPADLPLADALACYAQRFHSVEGNTTFYGLPSLETLARWRNQTHESFRFCPKLPRDVTHSGPLFPRSREALDAARRLSDGLGDRLGPIMLQLPPDYAPRSGPDLARFLNLWRREVGYPLVVEVRHPEWFQPEMASRLDTMLDRLGMGRVCLDTRPIHRCADNPQAETTRPKPDLPLHPTSSGGVAFVRFISHPRSEENERWLEDWSERVAAWLADGVQVWFFVHCPNEARSPENALHFSETLERAGRPRPHLPWLDLPPSPPPQRGLFDESPS